MRVSRLNTPKALSALRPLELSRKAKHRLVVEVHSQASAHTATGFLETLRQAQGKL